jgi:hypothetical protein
MHLLQLVRGPELQGFGAVLMPHQKAVRCGRNCFNSGVL